MRQVGRGEKDMSRSLRILFVDDERSLQETMRLELPRLGHEVTVCPDGRTAMKVMEKTMFDAAILDLRMPGMTGMEVLEHLKKVSPGPSRPQEQKPGLANPRGSSRGP